MIKILGGAKTGYNLYRLLKKEDIESVYFFFKDEYGEEKRGGLPIERIQQGDIDDHIIVSSETAFVYFKSLLEHKLNAHYHLRDKTNLSSVAKELEVKTITEQQIDSVIFPAFIKPKRSGEKIVPFKTKIVNSEKDLKKVEPHIDNCLIQRYLNPIDYEQIDIGGFFTGSGNSLISFKELNQYPLGIASYISVYESLKIINLKHAIESYLNRLGFRGFVEFEFQRNKKDDTYYLMDINPRPWGSFYYYANAIQNLRDVILNHDEPIINLKKSWVNVPRLVLSNLHGNFRNPSLKDILTNQICYEPYF